MRTYYAEGNRVYVRRLGGSDELFLTVWPTESTKTPDEQAETIADLLNDL